MRILTLPVSFLLAFLLYLPFPVKPETKYRFSFRIKGENLSFANKTQAPWGGVQASPSAEKPWIDKKGELISE